MSFRCIECRGCENCKRSDRVDSVSIQEEVEQHLMESKVKVDIQKGKSSALLPFVTDPDVRIDSAAQRNLALKIY